MENHVFDNNDPAGVKRWARARAVLERPAKYRTVPEQPVLLTGLVRIVHVEPANAEPPEEATVIDLRSVETVSPPTPQS